MPDVVVIGAGHNALVAAALLARAGRAVTVLEALPEVGGAAVTEHPFASAPDLGASTGAYLLGLMPPELLAELGLELPLVRRDPHYFLPTTGGRYLLIGSDRSEARRQFLAGFSAADWEAHVAMGEELTAIREDLAPAWLAPPLGLEETAERYLRPSLRGAFVELCRGSALDYLRRFGFRSDLIVAMYAVTDGLPGLAGGADSPGSGHNLLVHNMCRLPGADGTWMVVRGGMGTVTRRLAEIARAAGATIRTEAPVERVRVRGGAVEGVALAGGEEVDASVALSSADPFRTVAMVVDGALPEDYLARVGAMRREGMTLKLNLCLDGLPRFSCLPDDPRVFGPTIHLLPDEEVVLDELARAHADAAAGRLPAEPSIEWYVHTALDPSLRDGAARHSAALFVQPVPYRLAESSWEREQAGYAERLLAICDRFAPGTSDLAREAQPLPPPGIEARFGITGGSIHHVENRLAFADRLPYETPVQGLWCCGAGCHPAGSVIGAAGRNAAGLVLEALG